MAQKVYVKKVYVPFSLARISSISVILHKLLSGASMHSAISLSGPGLHCINCIQVSSELITVVSKLITDRNSFWGEFISNYRYRIGLPEESICITEPDLWEFQQKISHYRYRFPLEFQLLSITDADFGLEMNQFCNHIGYNGTSVHKHCTT